MCVSHLISKRFNKNDIKIGYKIVEEKWGNLISVNTIYTYCKDDWNIEKTTGTTACVGSDERYDVGFHIFTNKKDALKVYLYMPKNYLFKSSLTLYKVEYTDICTYGKEEFEHYINPREYVTDLLTIVVAKKVRFLEKLLPIDKQTKI